MWLKRLKVWVPWGQSQMGVCVQGENRVIQARSPPKEMGRGRVSAGESSI